MLNILIIGCGNIGKRHLFSLLNSNLKIKFNIQVLEKNTKSIQISKKINTDFNNYIKKYSQICRSTNLVICCTKSYNRDQVLKKTLKYCNPKHIILEKIAFQNMKIYNQMEKFFNKKKIKVWINYPLRYQKYYNYLKRLFFKQNNFFTIICKLSKKDDLFSSGIHYLEFFLDKLKNDVYLEFLQFKKKNIGNKKLIFFGKFVFSSQLRTIAVINGSSDFQQQLNLFGQSNNYKILFYSNKKNPWKNPKIQIFKNKKKIKTFNHLWQSQLSSLYLRDIIFKNKCFLPNLNENKKCNELIIEAVKKKLNLKKNNLCPIT